MAFPDKRNSTWKKGGFLCGGRMVWVKGGEAMEDAAILSLLR